MEEPFYRDSFSVHRLANVGVLVINMGPQAPGGSPVLRRDLYFQMINSDVEVSSYPLCSHSEALCSCLASIRNNQGSKRVTKTHPFTREGRFNDFLRNLYDKFHISDVSRRKQTPDTPESPKTAARARGAGH